MAKQTKEKGSKTASSLFPHPLVLPASVVLLSLFKVGILFLKIWSLVLYIRETDFGVIYRKYLALQAIGQNILGRRDFCGYLWMVL
jgi:hypothetical protein